jgi:hypothetical protein
MKRDSGSLVNARAYTHTHTHTHTNTQTHKRNFVCLCVCVLRERERERASESARRAWGPGWCVWGGPHEKAPQFGIFKV